MAASSAAAAAAPRYRRSAWGQWAAGRLTSSDYLAAPAPKDDNVPPEEQGLHTEVPFVDPRPPTQVGDGGTEAGLVNELVVALNRAH